jgi:nitrogen regulatory protein PII
MRADVDAIKSSKLITAILPKGQSLPVIEQLKTEKGLTTASFNFARGVGRMTPAKFRGVGEQSEKEVLTVVVAQELADELFEFIFDRAEINRPHGGIIYMQPLIQSTRYTLPDEVEEET